MSRFTPISTMETLDPVVFAKKVGSTRSSYANAQNSRVDMRDMADTESLQRVIQSLADEIALIGRVVSSMPFFGGVYIAKVVLTAGTPAIIRHGMAEYVDVMLTVASSSTGAATVAFAITAQNPDTQTVTVSASVSCVVAALIYPQKRGV